MAASIRGDKTSPKYVKKLGESMKGDFRFEGYRVIARHVKSTGAVVLNAAPWSAVRDFPFCDAEEELCVPGYLRVGISEN